MSREDISLKMSQRLITVADMLRSDGEVLRAADVGCDHGYVSIYLVQRKIASSVIAMDVRKGPLSAADANIAECGLKNSISTRLSDGVKELKKGEANAIVIAGMGGKLMERLIDEGNLYDLGIRRAVFQPQSDYEEFRQFIRDKGYLITDERVVYEDGKYYFPMKVDIVDSSFDSKNVFDKTLETLFSDSGDIDKDLMVRICNRYGECNLVRKEPLLVPYLDHGKEVLESILKSLDDSHTGRRKEIMEELSDISFAQKILNR
ncbi:class I SAM-dependent methyltransferase [Butyrivibrio proteoclasticus]|nr:class I SAM-dependent methyltransferase [Butyrivibrio proteoclasticus]